ncbi:MAG: FkbM family methyltransferase [Vicinamibacteria bacterium]
MSWAFKLLPGLSGAYATARRAGLMRVRWFRRGYTRAYFSYKRRFEDPFDGLVQRRPDLFAAGHILDVGAQIGYTSSLFVKTLSPGFKVYAFEPEAENFSLLNETIALSGASGRIVSVHAAVGDREGNIEFWTNPAHPGDHRVASAAFLEHQVAGLKTTPVRLVSLDGYLASAGLAAAPVAFVKIDVQGYEPAVCRGMTGLLARCPDVVVAIEMSPRELRAQAFGPAEVLSFFESRGYSIQLLAKDGSLSPFQGDGLDVEPTGRGYADLLCSRRALAG